MSTGLPYGSFLNTSGDKYPGVPAKPVKTQTHLGGNVSERCEEKSKSDIWLSLWGESNFNIKVRYDLILFSFPYCCVELLNNSLTVLCKQSLKIQQFCKNSFNPSRQMPIILYKSLNLCSDFFFSSNKLELPTGLTQPFFSTAAEGEDSGRNRIKA